MFLSKPTMIHLSLLLFSHFVHAAFGGSIALYMGHKCFNQLEFLINDRYSVYLNSIMIHLSKKIMYGYQSGFRGRYTGNNHVHGLAQCRSYSSSSVCTACLLDLQAKRFASSVPTSS